MLSSEKQIPIVLSAKAKSPEGSETGLSLPNTERDLMILMLKNSSVQDGAATHTTQRQIIWAYLRYFHCISALSYSPKLARQEYSQALGSPCCNEIIALLPKDPSSHRYLPVWFISSLGMGCAQMQLCEEHSWTMLDIQCLQYADRILILPYPWWNCTFLLAKGRPSKFHSKFLF